MSRPKPQYNDVLAVEGHWLDGVGKPLALALHALPAGKLTFAGGIERSITNLDRTLSLVMADNQAIWRDAGLSPTASL